MMPQTCCSTSHPFIRDPHPMYTTQTNIHSLTLSLSHSHQLTNLQGIITQRETMSTKRMWNKRLSRNSNHHHVDAKTAYNHPHSSTTNQRNSKSRSSISIPGEHTSKSRSRIRSSLRQSKVITKYIKLNDKSTIHLNLSLHRNQRSTRRCLYHFTISTSHLMKTEHISPPGPATGFNKFKTYGGRTRTDKVLFNYTPLIYWSIYIYALQLTHYDIVIRAKSD